MHACLYTIAAIGATWDPDLAHTWGAAMGLEFYKKGANVQLGPGVCLTRVPLNGRNFEYVLHNSLAATSLLLHHLFCWPQTRFLLF